MLRNCFLFVLVVVLTTGLFVAQTTWSNLLWLFEMQMPINGEIIITAMISDLMGLNGGGVLPIPMVAIVSVVLFIAFAVARTLSAWMMINPTLLYSIGGALGIWTLVFVMPFFFFDVDVMAGARTKLGKLVIAIIGGIGGYLFGTNLTRSKS